LNVNVAGSTKALETVMKKVNKPVYGLQCTDSVPQNSIEEMAAFYIKVYHNYLSKVDSAL